MRLRKFLTVAGRHDDTDAAAYIAQINIVEPRRRCKADLTPLQVIDMNARTLVGAYDQALCRIGGITPYRRIVRRILHRRNGLRLQFGCYRSRGQWAHRRLRRNATGKEQWQNKAQIAH